MHVRYLEISKCRNLGCGSKIIQAVSIGAHVRQGTSCGESRESEVLMLLYGKITRLPRPEFCPHFARRRTHLHYWERRFLHILLTPLTNRLSGAVFRGRKKMSKNRSPDYGWLEK